MVKALVLSGGGSKGCAFIGVFQAIEKLGLKYDLMGGTSAGAIMAAFYKAGYTSANIEADLRHFLQKNRSPEEVNWPEIFRAIVGVNNKHIVSLLKGQRLQDYIKAKLLKKNIRTFSDLGKGYFCTAVDIEAGRERIFHPKKAGHIEAYLPICASSAVPGVFPPVCIEDTWYVDGGVKSNYPILSAISLGATEVTVVAIIYMFDGEEPVVKRGFMDIMARSLSIVIHDQLEAEIECAAHLIGRDRITVVPIVLPFSRLTDFSGFDHMIEKGREEFLRVVLN